MKKISRYLKKEKIELIINHLFMIIFNRFFCLFPLKENRVLFISDVRPNVGTGNLGCMYNYLPTKYDKVTSFVPDRRQKRTLKEWFSRVYNISVSKYIFLDDYCSSMSYTKARKGQKIIQLWHGCGAYKKFGHSRSKKGGDLANESIHPGYKRYTNAIVTSEYIKPCYAEAFNIDESKVNALGAPRTDEFFDKKLIKKKKEELYKEYPYLKGKKVILFAPTYRGSKVNDADYDFKSIDLEKIYNKFKDEYVFIIKWHPALYNNIIRNIRTGFDISKYKDFYYDLSNERDVNDLLLISNILITDYSSIIFEWALLDKPIIYYAYDLENYASGRGLYFPFEEYIYGTVAKNSKELIKAIENEDMCEKERKEFVSKFMNACDGNATKKVYEEIFNTKEEK